MPVRVWGERRGVGVEREGTKPLRVSPFMVHPLTSQLSTKPGWIISKWCDELGSVLWNMKAPRAVSFGDSSLLHIHTLTLTHTHTQYRRDDNPYEHIGPWTKTENKYRDGKYLADLHVIIPMDQTLLPYHPRGPFQSFGGYGNKEWIWNVILTTTWFP